jgi:hypothetical protein
MRLGRDGRDRAYLRHGGRPVVAVWGVGFKDGRKYTLAESGRLVDFLRHDRRYGGNTVLLGVPTGWRTIDADCVREPELHRVLRKADLLSPWTVGRYRTLKGVEGHARRRWEKDLAWCEAHGKGYLPVVFPGFSWHNRHPKSPRDEVPRLEGRFLWERYLALKGAGATMAYQAMFDEPDEGTAVFKCADDPPAGKSRFVMLEGLPADHYLWLTGAGGNCCGARWRRGPTRRRGRRGSEEPAEPGSPSGVGKVRRPHSIKDTGTGAGVSAGWNQPRRDFERRKAILNSVTRPGSTPAPPGRSDVAATERIAGAADFKGDRRSSTGTSCRSPSGA